MKRLHREKEQEEIIIDFCIVLALKGSVSPMKELDKWTLGQVQSGLIPSCDRLSGEHAGCLGWLAVRTMYHETDPVQLLSESRHLCIPWVILLLLFTVNCGVNG